MQMLIYSIEKIEVVINEFIRCKYEYQHISIHNWQVWEDSDNIHS